MDTLIAFAAAAGPAVFHALSPLTAAVSTARNRWPLISDKRCGVDILDSMKGPSLSPFLTSVPGGHLGATAALQQADPPLTQAPPVPGAPPQSQPRPRQALPVHWEHIPSPAPGPVT